MFTNFSYLIAKQTFQHLRSKGVKCRIGTHQTLADLQKDGDDFDPWVAGRKFQWLFLVPLKGGR